MPRYSVIGFATPFKWVVRDRLNLTNASSVSSVVSWLVRTSLASASSAIREAMLTVRPADIAVAEDDRPGLDPDVVVADRVPAPAR
jgi:hypothetical protein